MGKPSAQVIPLQSTSFCDIRIASVHGEGNRVQGSRNEVWWCPAYAGADFEAQWWPVMLETVHGSGERLCVAVIVRSKGGQATVRQAIPPSTVASLFGPATGKGMMFMVGQTIIDLKRQLDEFVPVEALEPAFGGFQLGAMKDCIARDANEVFDIAMRLSTAFSLSTFGVEAPTADREAQRAFDEWAEKVKDQVLAMGTREALAQAFNVAVPLAGKKRLRVGFVLGGYVAQFGVLRIGRSMSADQRALKLKLFDLEALRRERALAFQDAELIVGVQTPGDSYPSRQREALAETWDFIMREASARGVTPKRYDTARAAGEHLRLLAA